MGRRGLLVVLERDASIRCNVDPSSDCDVRKKTFRRPSTGTGALTVLPRYEHTTVPHQSVFPMSLTCHSIIFDLDGVLVDSEAAVEQQWRAWAEHRGIPFEEVEAVYHGRPAFEVIQEVAPHLDADAETERMSGTLDTAPEALRRFDGAKKMLEDLPDERWTIATSGRFRTATGRLSHVGLPIPDTMVTADDIENGKPAPDPYLLAAERLGVEAERCVVLEDAPAGVESAQQAGATVIGVATATGAESLSAADAVVSSVADVEIEQNGPGDLHVHCPTTATHDA